jgi:RNA polymerase sigma-70 factor (ECF subfamily)
VTRISPRTPCRARSSRRGASCRPSATRTASRPGSRRRSTWTANVRALPVDGPAGPDDLLAIPDRDALDRAFRRLSVEQRAVFVLHHHAGLPLVEIAETLGIPAGTARSRLHYATQALRSAIEADAAPVVPEGRMA